MWEIYLILFTHWVSDFVTQSDRVAKGKSKNNFVLLEHVALYSLPFYGLAYLVFGSLLTATTYWGVNMLAHFITDYVTSRINSKLYQQGKTHEFFVCVGFDQLIHVSTLLGMWEILR